MTAPATGPTSVNMTATSRPSSRSPTGPRMSRGSINRREDIGMVKDLSLMEVTVLRPTKNVRDVCLWLEDNGATSMMVRAHRDNPLSREEKKHIKEVIASHRENGKHKRRIKRRGVGTGNTPGNKKKIRQEQQAWIAKNTVGEVTIGEMRQGWEEQGFAPGWIYGAFGEAIKLGVLKKLGPGRYRRIGE